MSDEEHKPSSSISGPASGRGINAFVMNIFLPGLGSIYAGQGGVGVGQLGLFGLGIILCFVFFIIGIPMVIGAWIWSVIVGFQLLSAK